MQRNTLTIITLFLVSTGIFAHFTDTSVNNSRFVDNSATRANANANSQGNGFSALNISRDGVQGAAVGQNGSGFNGAFDQTRNTYAANNGYNNNNYGNDSYNSNWGDNTATKAAVNVAAHGQGGVMGNAGANGVTANAVGSNGTHVGGSWLNNQNAYANNSTTRNRYRLLTANNNRENNYDSLRNLVDDLRNQIKDLKHENHRLQRNCGANNVGASN
jgi:hypothetical protein